jgi:hypothetical protein
VEQQIRFCEAADGGIPMREHDRCHGDQAEGDRDDPELHRVELVAGPFGDLVADSPLSDTGSDPEGRASYSGHV